jgi:hypothetical protein
MALEARRCDWEGPSQTMSEMLLRLANLWSPGLPFDGPYAENV